MALSRISISVSEGNSPLKCSVCLDLFRDPVSVPCGHSFCTACIQELWNLEGKLGRACSCPACAQVFPSRPALVKNIPLADVVRGVEEESSSPRSGDETGVRGRRGPSSDGEGCPTKRSKVAVGTSDAREWRVCAKHNDRPLEVYCCDDERCVCTLCAVVAHTGHTVVSVSEERKTKEEQVKSMKSQSKGMIQKVSKARDGLRRSRRKIQQGQRSAAEHCEGVFAMLVDRLQRHSSSVTELTAALETAVTARTDGSLERLELWLAELRRRDALLEQLSETEDDNRFFQGWSSLPPSPEPADLSCVTVDPLLLFESIRKAVEERGSQLAALFGQLISDISQMAGGERDDSIPQEEVDSEQLQSQSEILDTSSPDGVSGTPTPAGAAAQALEPTRAELLQYACKLTLDPSTAHKDLHISHNSRLVVWDPKKPKRDSTSVAPHPERFLRRRQVLCSQGLESDRCYYEVEVDGEQAEIALAYKGIERASLTKSSAFGGNMNSWSLDRSKLSYSVSHGGVSVKLTATPSQRRIGVYLKFKEGVLSFYEVLGDGVRFLHKIEATFTEPVYPGFWLGDKCSIRLCDPAYG